MGRPSNTLERRRQITRALEQVMSGHGYRGATIAEVARVAGLNSGLVHYHFKTKQEILLALLEQIAQSLERRYRTRVELAGGEPVAELVAFIQAHLALGDDADPALVGAWVTIGAEAIVQDEVRRMYTHALRRRAVELTRLCRRALKARRGNGRGASDMSLALASAIEGTYLLSVAAPGLITCGSGARSVTQMARGFLGELP
jgi:TetR/AcrR family transcriptional repressor of bet genes